MKKNNNTVQIPTSTQEEKLFRWIESDQCLGTWMPGKEATILERTKYQFSQAITRHHIRNNLSEEVIAERLDLDKFTTAKLLRGYVESFALDSLISYVEKLHLPLQVKITSEESGLNRTLIN